MNPPFVHLHLHSEFSLTDGIVRLGPLVEKCVEFEQPAVALTDVSNLYAFVKFYQACLKKGVKPVIGCDVWIENPLENLQCDRVVLFCQDRDGFRNLSRILTRAYLEGEAGEKITLRWHDLRRHHSGLICMLDDQYGPVARLSGHDRHPETRDIVRRYHDIFGDRLYFEISRIGRAEEQAYINQVLKLSGEFPVSPVATNRVQYLQADDFGAHEIRVCINEGRVLDDSRRPRNFTNQQYLRSSAEMADLFSDIPEAISNTAEIAKRCNLFIEFDEDFLPEYPESGGAAVEDLLRRKAEAGLAGRFGKEGLYHQDGTPMVEKTYLDRLNNELEVIEQMGYPGYFLIVADFIQWSKDNGIPVGPGRGSGAGSLVAWATGITEIDPLPYGLIFERFLNPERVSLPDFDIDFCVDGRDRVIEYVAEKYGQEQVAQIITFGTMAAKAVVRDVGRVMGYPYGFVDQIAKLIPFQVGMTLDMAFEQEERLRNRYQEESDVQQLMDAAFQLEGIARNVGKHAGGVVISPQPLVEYTPLFTDAHLNQAITQLDKDDLESIGLVKFDFLGLRTLTIIDSAVKMINQQAAADGSSAVDLAAIPLDDADTFEFIRTGKTTAIFQLESRGMKDLIIRAHPETFEDLIALIAMFRPGPLQSGMVEDFVNRKAGRESISILHPEIEHVLDTTYGVILYQEQVMQIAQTLAGYTLGGADILRKAMGKKLPEEMAKQRETFLDGAVNRGVPKHVANAIFDLMDKFAGYGFNKSHSAAYALVSYHTAWLKTHFPSAYMAATLSAESDHTDKVVSLLADCAALGLEVLPPDINTSFYPFKPLGEDKISFGLGAIKGVGRSVIGEIVEERERGGEFQDLFDFCRRFDMRKVNKRVLEALIKSGSMDKLGKNRAVLMSELVPATRAANQQQSNQQAGQYDMFGVERVQAENSFSADVPDWTEDERLKAEKETLGLYLTGHPYHQYMQEFAGISEADVSTGRPDTARDGIVAGIIVSVRLLKTRRGKMAVVTLDNAVQRIDVVLFSEKYTEYFAKLENEGVLVALGEISADELTGEPRMRAELLFDVEEVRNLALHRIDLHVAAGATRNATRSLRRTLDPFRGGKTGLRILYTTAIGVSGTINLGKNWCITPGQQLLGALQEMLGKENLTYHYNREVLFSLVPQKPHHRTKEAVNH
ncbi:MAG: DNA polymerase III subunit alpha [Gammaproteobacteria bacterium]|nr:DNA polymerase III subunit alpha [Gammaproteobacteria bacterium]